MVCFDETNRQLIAERRQALPLKAGQAARYDDEYVRNGVANLFMLFEPLANRREVSVHQRRTAKDFAQCLRELSQIHYPDAEKIIVVMDNLNTHSLSSLYVAFEPQEARRLCERFEIHYTPKHGSWLTMAELEISVMSRQCLQRRIPTIETLSVEVHSWVSQRNSLKSTVHWQFSASDARLKLSHLYPPI